MNNVDGLRYRFWIQTSIEEADEGTEIGQLKVKNESGGGGFGSYPCLNLILDDKYLLNTSSRIDVHYVDGNGVQQHLTLRYAPNANKVKVVLPGAGTDKGLNSISDSACSAT